MNDFQFTADQLCPEDDRINTDNLKKFAPYYKVKYEICKSIMPFKIAEIGVRAGYSAWSFLQASPESVYIGIDANNGTHGGGKGGLGGTYKKWAKQLLSQYNCTFIETDTQKIETIPGLTDVDLFHVDGDHTFKGVQHDLDLAFATLNKTGYILVDDVDYIEDVAKGVEDWILRRPNVKADHIQSLRGEVLIRKEV